MTVAAFETQSVPPELDVTINTLDRVGTLPMHPIATTTSTPEPAPLVADLRHSIVSDDPSHSTSEHFSRLLTRQFSTVSEERLTEFLAHFPESQRDAAGLVLSTLADAQNPVMMCESLLLHLQSAKGFGRVTEDRLPLVVAGAGSITSTLQYLYNRSCLPSYTDVPVEARTDRSGLRIVRSHSFVSLRAAEERLANGQGVILIFDQLTRAALEDPDQHRVLNRILNHPNTELVIPLGQQLGHRVQELSERTRELVLSVLTLAELLAGDEEIDQLTIQHAIAEQDEIVKMLFATSRELAMKASYASPPCGSNFDPEETLSALNGRSRTPPLESLTATLAQIPAPSRSLVLNYLDESAVVFDWNRTYEAVEALLDEITQRAAGRKILFVIPEEATSHAVLAAILMHDDRVSAADVITPAEVKDRENALETAWRKGCRTDPSLPRPDFDRDVVLVIVDDTLATGRQVQNLVQATRSSLPFGSNAKQREGRPSIFDGEIIIAPLVLTTLGQRVIESKCDRSTLGNVSLCPYLQVPVLEDSLTYKRTDELLRSLLELGLGGPGNLGMNNCATNLIFPWGAPNNNSLLFSDLARMIAPPKSVKPPFGRRHSSFAAYTKSSPGLQP